MFGKDSSSQSSGCDVLLQGPSHGRFLLGDRGPAPLGLPSAPGWSSCPCSLHPTCPQTISGAQALLWPPQSPAWAEAGPPLPAPTGLHNIWPWTKSTSLLRADAAAEGVEPPLYEREPDSGSLCRTWRLKR